MQSQQKRVKWSRGETAEALEERTDTGITQASVELMENCIPDIYGNISRRPALKPIPVANTYIKPDSSPYLGFHHSLFLTDVNIEDKSIQFIPFYISENDIILIGVNTGQYIRIKNDKIVQQYNGSSVIENGYYDVDTGKYTFPKVSFAQQNNYMIIATDLHIYKLQFSFDNYDIFTPVVENFEYSAGWYAPNGTQTSQINNINLPGLEFSGGFSNYTYTDEIGTTTVYSQISTGLTGTTGLENIQNTIPVGSIIQLPNIGCSLRVEGYYLSGGNVIFPDVVFDSSAVVDDSSQIPQTGHACVAWDGHLNSHGNNYEGGGYFEHYNNGVLVSRFPTSGNAAQGVIYRIRSNTSQTGEEQNSYTSVKVHLGSPLNIDVYKNQFGTWEEAPAESQTVYVYGPLLTPVVDESETDKIVQVETGYVTLQPEYYADGASLAPGSNIFPHPLKLCFNEQRLWAGGWAFTAKEQYALVIGSQVARYNDFKNDYNQENEAITLDVLTQFKEKVVHLVDYNGLKIFTDSYEYAYNSGGIVKQSANGALAFCDPIVFESLCLYADSTGNQIRAMQYEFQNNIFNSSCINQVASHDLVWYPTYMAQYEDKVNNTGKYLFIVNEQINNNSLLAVCNFVPSNQANIWNRWTFPQFNKSRGGIDYTSALVHSIVNTKGRPIFMLKCNLTYHSTVGGGSYDDNTNDVFFVPCYLDFEEDLDLQGTISVNKEYIINSVAVDADTTVYQTVPNAEIAVYSDGEFQFTTTTDKYGKITDDLTGLTNITAGLMINSKVVSHPIDVGGKTKSVMKRIGKTQVSVHDTSAGAITINNKTGYMNPRGDHICFYGVTGMKDEIKYTITNNNGAMFHLESLLMNIEYGTLDS